MFELYSVVSLIGVGRFKGSGLGLDAALFGVLVCDFSISVANRGDGVGDGLSSGVTPPFVHSSSG